MPVDGNPIFHHLGDVHEADVLRPVITVVHETIRATMHVGDVDGIQSVRRLGLELPVHKVGTAA